MSFDRLPINISHLFEVHCKEVINRTVKSTDIGRFIIVNEVAIKLTSDNIDNYTGTRQDFVNDLAHTLDGIDPVYCTELMLQDEAGRRIGSSTEFSMGIVPDVVVTTDAATGDILTYSGGVWTNRALDNISGVIVDGSAIAQDGNDVNIPLATTTARGCAEFAVNTDESVTDKMAKPDMVSSMVGTGFKPKLVVGSNVAASKFYLDNNSGTTYPCGTSLTDVTVGSHTVHFVAVTGAVAPAAVTVNVTDDSVAVAYGKYVFNTFKVRVHSNVNCNWSPDGSTWYSLDKIVTRTVQATSIRFGAVAGYITPSSISIGTPAVGDDIIVNVEYIKA